MTNKQISSLFKAPPQAVASYDYNDLVSGFGYQTFYLAISKDSTASTYKLVTQEVYSANGQTDLDEDDEVNFDSSTFNSTRVIKGTFYMTGSLYSIGTNGPGQFTARLLRVDADDAEHEIFSIITSPQSPKSTRVYYLLEASCTTTTIKKGEKLRLEVIGIAGGNKTHIGTSPRDQDAENLKPSTTDCTTITRLFIPFKIRD